MTSELDEQAANAANGERNRISAIMALPAAGTRPKFANYIALKTALSVAEARTFFELAGHEVASNSQRANSMLGHLSAANGSLPRVDIVADMRQRHGL